MLFNLVHISDLHISNHPDRVGASDLWYYKQFPRGKIRPLNASSWNVTVGLGVKRSLKCLHWANPLDAVLITGDLATTGSHSDLSKALSYVEEIIADIAWATGPASAAGSAIRRVILFPGNHDRYRWGSKLPGCRRFDKIFRSYWTHPVQTTVLEREGESLAIVQADFTLRRWRHTAISSPLDFLGQGRVYGDVLSKLCDETGQHQQHGRAVVWAVHFPPGFKGLGYGLRLQDQMDLIHAATRCGIGHIFAGHTHIQRQYEVAGVTVYCAGTATQLVAPRTVNKATNSIHPLKVEVKGGNVATVVWEEIPWNEGMNMFEI